MALIDGFDLKFVSRTGKAERRHKGRLIDTIPVSWAASWRQGPAKEFRAPKGSKEAPPRRDVFVEVCFQDAAEMQARKTDPEPFVVALAVAKTAAGVPDKFSEFRGVFEVAVTGAQSSTGCLETKVICRLTPAADA